jgi:hypothetical protein
MQGQLKSMNNALPNDQKSADAAKQSADVASSSLVLSQQSFKVQQRPYVCAPSRCSYGCKIQ